ncbi:MAG: low molecular weight protein-tyrosine-phosphatase [Kangiellaceae bacterium]|jgi:protein-tyrosine phosphatase|nr:low molecular weight protein-tyrosine-phosphatase [Kangiellaceae bacterium]
MTSEKTRVLFVCLGNICRSPTAEGVFRQLIEQRRLAHRFDIDSAGTSAYHVGEQPDKRAMEAARKRQIELSTIRSRALTRDDFSKYDYLIAMDRNNYKDMQAMTEQDFRSKVHLFLDFANVDESDVPDPYYGGPDGFEHVLNLVEQASRGLLAHIERQNC